jgi:hypothetical protein
MSFVLDSSVALSWCVGTGRPERLAMPESVTQAGAFCASAVACIRD